MTKAKTALVTGGSGFLGSHLCEALINKGYKVIALDNLYSSSITNLANLQNNSNFKFVFGDVTDLKTLEPLVKKADIIFHLAAVLGVSKIMENPLLTMNVNVNGVQKVCETSYKNGKKKVVFTSSSEAYGKSQDLPLRESGNLLFGSTKITRWNYGLSKAMGEHILFSYAQKGLPISIVRLFNSYGPRGVNNTYAHVIPKFISRAIKGEPIPVLEDGNQSRTFCFVTDTVAGIILASEKLHNDLINLGSNKEVTILELAKRIVKITKSKSKLEFISNKKMYGENFEDVRRRIPDVSKAKKVLGFVQKIGLTEGIKMTTDWVKSSKT